MIEFVNQVFAIHGETYSCLLGLTAAGQLEQLYFGRPVATADAEAFRVRPGLGWGTAVLLQEGDTASCPDVWPLAWSGSGRGDYRESPIQLECSTDLRYESHEILEGDALMEQGLPQALGAEQTLVITMSQPGLRCKLYFAAFPGVLTRRTVLENTGEESVTVGKLMSFSMDLPGRWEMTTFHGGWIAEMNGETRPVGRTRLVNESTTGFSSNRHNPGFLLSRPGAAEEAGEVIGINLVYSGNHYASAQLSHQELTRVMQGISPDHFHWPLQPGEKLETPEAVLCYSAAGFGGQSAQMHDFVNHHIVPAPWQGKARPVLYNSWEGCMFDFDQRKLLRLAREAKSLGCELFVLDDGWFGKRNDDTSSLGDYTVNRKKLPGGLTGLARKIGDMGMDFGLWVEPESVNPDSDLYRAHPDWVLTDDFAPVLSRNQLLLDLTRPEVRDYIVEQVSAVLDSARITYVKWDMNRHSVALGAKAHAYILGLYDVQRRIFTPRPHILLENCASGGNRFDLGMLCFGPQIWCSDNTDPIQRLTIQGNLSQLYPQSTFGTHVSAAPHAQTLRNTPLVTRGNVSFFGCLGYELDLRHLLELEKQEIRQQITFYKQYRETFQFGRFGRIPDGWQVQKEGVTVAGQFRTLVPAAPGYGWLQLRGLESGKRYHLTSRQQKLRIGQFGALVKHVAPVDLNPNGLVLRTADRHITLPDGAQELTATGAALMAGIPMLPPFRGTGYDQNQRTLTDFGSELFIIEEETSHEKP
ncbi:MAG: alpha-galactosidase [Ruminococcaceae bacterium]|nr:alpha-galactosidase [Oscillospiraceae bacterium]